MKETMAARIANIVDAYMTCENNGNAYWHAKHEEALRQIERNVLPHGAGFDFGTTVDVDKSTSEKLVFHTSFHHMNDAGMYDGWTEHKVIVRPRFDGLDVRVTGRNRNDIKNYIGDVFYQTLTKELTDVQTYGQAYIDKCREDVARNR